MKRKARNSDLYHIMVGGGAFGKTEIVLWWYTFDVALVGTQQLADHLETFGIKTKMVNRWSCEHKGTYNTVLRVESGQDWFDTWLAVASPPEPPSSNRGVTKND